MSLILFIEYVIFSSTIQTDTGTILTDSTTTIPNKLARQISQVMILKNEDISNTFFY
jgi:hypothetical protein